MMGELKLYLSSYHPIILSSYFAANSFAYSP
jgi:hypothetical protein